MASLEHCCLLCPEGQQGTSTSITHSAVKKEKWKLQTVLELSEGKEHMANVHSSWCLFWPEGWRWTVIQHFILKSPSGMGTMQWASSWTEVKEPLRGSISQSSPTKHPDRYLDQQEVKKGAWIKQTRCMKRRTGAKRAQVLITLIRKAHKLCIFRSISHRTLGSG